MVNSHRVIDEGGTVRQSTKNSTWLVAAMHSGPFPAPVGVEMSLFLLVWWIRLCTIVSTYMSNA